MGDRNALPNFPRSIDSLTKQKIDWLKKYHMQETQTLQFCCICILDIDMKSPRALSCKANMFSAKPP